MEASGFVRTGDCEYGVNAGPSTVYGDNAVNGLKTRIIGLSMIAFVLAILLASATTSATPAFEVRTTDGQRHVGRPGRLGASG